ncbi:O-antigen polymerase [Maribacter sp. TH_r10]|uniref:O-antigen polymerase n=1 Tax=Maribacter sp. TH_r10 TaxID=3082086 RepID=UPI002955CFD0|nr:O-antigen polymerase [Maribacter sp. TH_r10]MDV7137583.1 O-antigen polymerase [Maribacter sp. TH_r10]
MDKKLASPKNAAIYGVLFWVALYLMAPISYTYPFNFISIALLVSCYLLFFLGYFIGIKVKLLDYPIDMPKEKKWLFYFFFIISLISILLLILDKFILRGASLSQGAFANREILANAPPTILGIIGNFIRASVFLTLFLYFKLRINHKRLLIISYSFLFYFILESFLTGSRAIPVFYSVLTLLILFHFKLLRFKMKNFLVLLALGLVFFVILTEIFISRTMEFMGTRERAIEFILMKGSYMDYTILDKSFITFILSINSFYIQSFFVGLASFYTYYLHSIVEFSYLIDHFDAPSQFGSHTFFVIFKFFELIFGGFDGRAYNYIPRPGKYITFFGDIYMDFKGWAVIFMFLFGYWQARIYKTAITKSNFTVIPLILFLCILNFLFPVFNLISGGNGIYLIIGFLFMSYTYKLLSYITVNTKK